MCSSLLAAWGWEPLLVGVASSYRRLMAPKLLPVGIGRRFPKAVELVPDDCWSNPEDDSDSPVDDWSWRAVCGQRQFRESTPPPSQREADCPSSYVPKVWSSEASTSAHDGSESAGALACSAAPARTASWPPWDVASSEVERPETLTRTVGATAWPFIKPSRSDPTLLSSYDDDMLLKPPYHHSLARYAHGAAAGAASVGSGAGGAPAPAGQGPSASSLVHVQGPGGVNAIGTKGGAGTKGSAGKGGHDDSGSGARGLSAREKLLGTPRLPHWQGRG